MLGGEKMGFSKMMELLQTKEKGRIVFCNMGNFYVAIGKDAVLLNQLIDIKVSCFKEEICKVGFPIISLEKYTDKIEEKQYSYVIYYFDQKREKLEILKRYNGKRENKILQENINCYICSKNINKYKKQDKYIQALTELYQKGQESNKLQGEEKKKIWFQSKNKKKD